MKKNIYLIIITIITVVCIIAGSLYHIGGFALGLFDNLIPRSDKSLGNVCTEELSVDEFSNLVFDTTISNINVKTGDSYMVSYKCNKRLVPKIRSTGDTLTISQSKGANYRRSTTSEITVTIPKGAALNKLSFDTGVGEVNLNSLTAADAEFDIQYALYHETADLSEDTLNRILEFARFAKAEEQKRTRSEKDPKES